jgi:hypothetical protein
MSRTRAINSNSRLEKRSDRARITARDQQSAPEEIFLSSTGFELQLQWYRFTVPLDRHIARQADIDSAAAQAVQPDAAARQEPRKEWALGRRRQ